MPDTGDLCKRLERVAEGFGNGPAWKRQRETVTDAVNELTRAESRIEELEGALERIAKASPTPAIPHRDIARAALKGKS